MIYRYDEQELIRRLDSIAAAHRTAFAAACAERLLPAYDPIARLHASGGSSIRVTLDNVWNSAAHAEPVDGDDLLSTLPPDIEDWATVAPYAEDAIVSVVYSARASRSGSSQDAAWAARRVYEALDQFVLNMGKVSLGEQEAESKILAHPLIQAELRRQEEDLNDLAAGRPTGDPQLVRQLKNRARANAYQDLSLIDQRSEP